MKIKKITLHNYIKKNFLYFSILTFLFISITALAMTKRGALQISRKGLGVKVLGFSQKTQEYTPIPILSGSAIYPTFSARSVLAVDVNSGVTLFEKNPDRSLLPASTTKIVTALVAIDYYPRAAVLKVNGLKVDGQKMGLVAGEEITADSLLKGLLVASANDAAEVLAYNYPGSTEAFVDAMNEKASEISLQKTYLTNPSGFDTYGHSTTARDLIRAASYAMKNSYFSEIVGIGEVTVTDVSGLYVHRLVNINELIGSVEGVLGVKTGWTENAHENLVTYVERGGRKVMIAILGSQDRFAETEELIDWIFENYEWREVLYP